MLGNYLSGPGRIVGDETNLPPSTTQFRNRVRGSRYWLGSQLNDSVQVEEGCVMSVNEGAAH